MSCESNTGNVTYKTIPIGEKERWNNAMTIMKKLLNSNLGLEDFQAAAIVGNMYAESRWNPTLYVASDAGQGQSGGLCQWHDSVNGSGRFTNLVNNAKTMNKTWQDIEVQLAYLVSELNGTGQHSEKKALIDLKNTSNIEDATVSFCTKFERPKNAQAKGRKRITYSKQVLEKWNAQNS